MATNIQWLGHDTFKISDGPMVIYTDPFQLEEGGDKADIILITHEHYDHCVPEDVAKIQKDDTVIVTTAPCAARMKGDVRVVKAGDKLEVKGVPIEVTWAYNLNKFREPGKPFHPKSPDYVGYVFTVEGERIYLAGDTDHIPEMDAIECDIALVPVSGTYVMTAEEAAAATNNSIKPRKSCIPMHYDAIVGTGEDAEKFAKGVQGAKVEILVKS